MLKAILVWFGASLVARALVPRGSTTPTPA
jgi:hypothetical protein